MSKAIKTFLLGIGLAGLATLICPHMWSGLRRTPAMQDDAGNPAPG